LDIHQVFPPDLEKDPADSPAERAASHAGENKLSRLLLCAIFAGLLTGVIVQYSFRHGRLIQYPIFDDVGYFADGMMRVQAFHDGGFRAVWQQYRRNPPHSPYSDGLAALAFAVFGPRDWAPYLCNGLLALAFFVCVERLIMRAALWEKILCLLFVATIPFMGMAVHEFRPDHMVSLLTAAGIVAAMARPAVRCSRNHKLLVGALFGLAMWVKPPVFPATTILFMTSVTVSTICDRWANGPFRHWSDVLLAWVTYWVLFVAIPLPHYLVNFTGIVSYIHEILFGAYKNSYELRGSASTHLLYFISGDGGRIMLGWHVYLLLGLLVLMCGWTYLASTRAQRIQTTGLLTLLLLSLAIPTANRTKSPFFGLTFDILLTFTGLYLLGRAMMQQKRAFSWPGVILAACAAIGLAQFQWPSRYGSFNTPWIVDRSKLVHGAYDTTVARTHVPENLVTDPVSVLPLGCKLISQRPRTCIVGAGDINSSLYSYWATRALRPAEFYSAPDVADLQVNLRALADADYVIICEPGSRLMADFLPSYPIYGPLIDALHAGHDFREVARFPFIMSGKNLLVFQRVDYFGWSPAGGMGEFEGPFPELGNRVVIWGYGPQMHIILSAPADGDYNLVWEARNGFPDEQLTLILDGREINRRTLPAETVFSGARAPMTLSAGAHDLVMRFSKWDTTSTRPLAVLFRKLRLEPEKAK